MSTNNVIASQIDICAFYEISMRTETLATLSRMFTNQYDVL